MRVLKNHQTGLTGREISRIAGISPKTGIKALSYLEDLGVVNRIRGGRDHIFSFNRENLIVRKGILPLLESEFSYRESLLKDISAKLKRHSQGGYLFGSVARKEETISSDLDICIIYNSIANKSSLEDLVSQLKPELYKRYSVNIAPYYISELEFVRRAKKNKPPLPDIINDGIILFGKQIKQLVNAKKIAKNKH